MCMKSLSEIAKDVIRGYMENGNEYDRKELVDVIDTVAERHYKVNEQYLKRLLPYVEQLGAMLENAENAV